jgi:Ca2+:H+ antiporter
MLGFGAELPSKEEPAAEGAPAAEEEDPMGCCEYAREVFYDLFLSARLNILLIAVPLAFGAKLFVDGSLGDVPSTQPGSAMIVIFALIALCPLAERLSYVTEKIADKLGSDMLGGLLNATCGNIPELIVVSVALANQNASLVQDTLVGGVLSNLLLVCGLSFFFGGLVHYKQTYNVKVSSTFIGTLMLPVMACVLCDYITTYQLILVDGNETNSTNGSTHTFSYLAPKQQWRDVRAAPMGAFMRPTSGGFRSEMPEPVDIKDPRFISPVLDISRAFAVVLIIGYCIVMAFQLVTHSEDFEDNDDEEEGEEKKKSPFGLVAGKGWCKCVGSDDDDEGVEYGVWLAFSLVVFFSGLISVLADFIVDAIKPAAEEMHLYETFITSIIIPNVANAPEHAVAIIFALKGKLNTSIAISVGSAAQIASFILPLAILIGWGLDVSLSLQLPSLEVNALLVSSIVATTLLAGGASTWATGSLLILTYGLVVGGFYTVPVLHIVNPDAFDFGTLNGSLPSEDVLRDTPTGLIGHADHVVHSAGWAGPLHASDSMGSRMGRILMPSAE